jgi:DNA-binding NtrC family response regulator
LDIGLPDTKGINILKEIREVDKNIKVVILISENLAEDVQRQLSIDARTVFLRKDIDKLQLIQSICSILKEQEIDKIEKDPSFKGSIMIIDDEEEANTLIRTYLERRGYNATSVFNGEESLLKIKMNKPQIVILDIRMRGMDGMLILKRIKEIDKSIVVIMTSGISDEAVIAEAMKMGAAGYLIKPFNLAKLEAAILANTLSRKPTNRETV